MKRSVGILGILTLALASCSGGVVDKAGVPTTVEPAIVQTSSAPATTPAPSSTRPVATLTPEPTKSSATPAPPVEDDAVSMRGNGVIKKGDAVTFSDFDGGLLGTMTLNAIETNVKCAADADPPENGRFIALKVSMVTEPPSDSGETFYLNPTSFTVIAANGTQMNGDVSSFPAMLCLDDSEVAPFDLGPGRKATGLIVLDVPKGAGVLVYNDGLSPGWEIEYPAK